MNEKFQEMLDLDQKIAEARARVEMEKSLPERGMLSPGIFDYITEGKSDLYKGYYDAVRAREMQDAQMANQRLMQERQLENALRLAEESRAAQDSRNASDFELKRKQANIRLRAAQTALANAQAEGNKVAIDNAQKELELSMAEAEWLNEQAGITPVKTVENIPSDTPEDTQEVPQEPVSKGVRIADLKAINKFATDREKNKTLSDIKKDPLYNQDPNIRSEYNRLSKIRSAEAGAKVISDLQKIVDNGGNPDPSKLKAEGLIIDIKTDKKTGKKTRKVIKDPKTK